MRFLDSEVYDVSKMFEPTRDRMSIGCRWNVDGMSIGCRIHRLEDDWEIIGRNFFQSNIEIHWKVNGISLEAISSNQKSAYIGRGLEDHWKKCLPIKNRENRLGRGGAILEPFWNFWNHFGTLRFYTFLEPFWNPAIFQK